MCAFINIVFPRYLSTSASWQILCQALVTPCWIRQRWPWPHEAFLKAPWWGWGKRGTPWWRMESIEWQSNLTFLGIVLLNEPVLEPTSFSLGYSDTQKISRGENLLYFLAVGKELRDQLHRCGFHNVTAGLAFVLTETWKLACSSLFFMLRLMAL